jgi:hypothetical protein
MSALLEGRHDALDVLVVRAERLSLHWPVCRGHRTELRPGRLLRARLSPRRLLEGGGAIYPCRVECRLHHDLRKRHSRHRVDRDVPGHLVDLSIRVAEVGRLARSEVRQGQVVGAVMDADWRGLGTDSRMERSESLRSCRSGVWTAWRKLREVELFGGGATGLVELMELRRGERGTLRFRDEGPGAHLQLGPGKGYPAGMSFREMGGLSSDGGSQQFWIGVRLLYSFIAF